jgi:hypothetical protein
MDKDYCRFMHFLALIRKKKQQTKKKIIIRFCIDIKETQVSE